MNWQSKEPFISDSGEQKESMAAYLFSGSKFWEMVWKRSRADGV